MSDDDYMIFNAFRGGIIPSYCDIYSYKYKKNLYK